MNLVKICFSKLLHNFLSVQRIQSAEVSVLSHSMALVESIPQHMKYKANVTFGIPLEEVWKNLISEAKDQVEVASFYWTLTGEDINVNSSSDLPVSYQLKRKYKCLPGSIYFCAALVCCHSVLNREKIS